MNIQRLIPTAVRNADILGFAGNVASSVRKAFTGDAYGPTAPEDRNTDKVHCAIANSVFAAFAYSNPLVPAVVAAMDIGDAFGSDGPKKNASIRLVVTAALTTGLFVAVGPVAALAGVVPKVYADVRDTFFRSPAPKATPTPEVAS